MFYFVFALVIIFFIVRKIYFDKVKKISRNIEQLDLLNSKYDFEDFVYKKRNISHPTKSRRSFENTDWEDVMLYHIENDINSIKEDIQTAIENENKYDEYLKDYNSIDLVTPVEEMKSERISEKRFYRIEKKILKKQMIKNVYDISVNLTIYYRSPKGKSFYRKDVKLDYEDLVGYYNLWKKKKHYEVSARYERSIMSDNIRYNVLKRDGFKCCICGMTSKDGAKLHVDHIIPVSKGGKTTMDNLQTLCERCNLGKSNKLDDEN